MSFIDHSIAWLRGEIFEAWMLILWGAALLVMSALFWFFARTATIHSLFLPFAIVGLLWGAAGAVSLYSNNNRLTSYQMAFEADPEAFVQAERKHVDGFIWAYAIGSRSFLRSARTTSSFGGIHGPTPRARSRCCASPQPPTFSMRNSTSLSAEPSCRMGRTARGS